MSVKLQHDALNCWWVNMFTRQPDLEQVWKFKKVTQRSMSNLSKILIGRILLSSYNLIRQFMKSYHIYKVLPDAACLKVKTVTQRSRSNLFEILMSRTSLPVKLQHDTGKFWCISIFTRSCKMLPFELDLAQKVKRVRQRLTSNSSENLMCRISL